MLCGILVDEGKLKWGQTLGETFPELKKSMNPQYQAVTLEQLSPSRRRTRAIEKDQLWANSGSTRHAHERAPTPPPGRHFRNRHVAGDGVNRPLGR